VRIYYCHDGDTRQGASATKEKVKDVKSHEEQDSTIIEQTWTIHNKVGILE